MKKSKFTEEQIALQDVLSKSSGAHATQDARGPFDRSLPRRRAPRLRGRPSEPLGVVLPVPGERRCATASTDRGDCRRSGPLRFLEDLRAVASGRLEGQPQARLPALLPGRAQSAAQAPSSAQSRGPTLGAHCADGLQSGLEHGLHGRHPVRWTSFPGPEYCGQLHQGELGQRGRPAAQGGRCRGGDGTITTPARPATAHPDRQRQRVRLDHYGSLGVRPCVIRDRASRPTTRSSNHSTAASATSASTPTGSYRSTKPAGRSKTEGSIAIIFGRTLRSGMSCPPSSPPDSYPNPKPNFPILPGSNGGRRQGRFSRAVPRLLSLGPTT